MCLVSIMREHYIYLHKTRIRCNRTCYDISVHTSHAQERNSLWIYFGAVFLDKAFVLAHFPVSVRYLV